MFLKFAVRFACKADFKCLKPFSRLGDLNNLRFCHNGSSKSVVQKHIQHTKSRVKDQQNLSFVLSSILWGNWGQLGAIGGNLGAIDFLFFFYIP